MGPSRARISCARWFVRPWAGEDGAVTSLAAPRLLGRDPHCRGAPGGGRHQPGPLRALPPCLTHLGQVHLVFTAQLIQGQLVVVLGAGEASEGRGLGGAQPGSPQPYHDHLLLQLVQLLLFLLLLATPILRRGAGGVLAASLPGGGGRGHDLGAQGWACSRASSVPGASPLPASAEPGGSWGAGPRQGRPWGLPCGCSGLATTACHGAHSSLGNSAPLRCPWWTVDSACRQERSSGRQVAGGRLRCLGLRERGGQRTCLKWPGLGQCKGDGAAPSPGQRCRR